MKVVALVSALTLAFGVSVAFAGPEVSKSTIEIGEGKTVNLKGSPMPLGGTAIKVGDALPASMLTAGDMSGVNLADKKGKVKIISVVPSVDTPVCEEQTHELSEKNGGIDKDVELYTVSMDLPFAQSRFSKEAKIGNVTFLSDYKGADFGNKHGLLVKPINLLSRALIVTDKDNIVRYMQVVPELTTLPDMAEAVKVAKSLQ